MLIFSQEREGLYDVVFFQLEDIQKQNDLSKIKILKSTKSCMTSPSSLLVLLLLFLVSYWCSSFFLF
jgi:hypothetical protein